jgi:hypothetical protein
MKSNWWMSQPAPNKPLPKTNKTTGGAETMRKYKAKIAAQYGVPYASARILHSEFLRKERERVGN